MTSLWLENYRAHPIPADGFAPGGSYDVVIAGAGLTGLATAVMFARAGRSVAVLEARQVGAVTTGNTTAKLSLLQGTVLSGIRSHASDRVLRAYVEGNRQGQEWMLRFLAERKVAVERRDAYTYAGTPEGARAIEREYWAARAAGLPVERTEAVELPYRTFGALRLAEQAQFDPMEVLAALAQELRARGGVIAEGVRVRGVDAGKPCRVMTPAGDVFARRVILATGIPILNRALYFAKLKPSRSYAQAYLVPGERPQGMYLSADSPTRSLRTAGEHLIVGGNSHTVGRSDSELEQVRDLESWTKEHFPGAELTHSWSAQDYRSANLVPFVGWLPRGGGKIYLATGFNKWGMTNAVAAALSLTADLHRRELPWAKRLHRRVTYPPGIADGVAFNAEVAGLLARDWIATGLTTLPEAAPPEGSGVVGMRGPRPTAVSTVDGRVCAVSAACTHLGGVLSWNDAERSWDCPLHGSRFTANGRLLEGPATRNLEVLG